MNYDRGGGRSGYTGGRADRTDRTIGEIWPDYLKGGYFDTNGSLRVEFVRREKVEPLAQEMASAFPRLTSNQVRRFFGHCRAVEARLRAIHGADPAARWASAAPDVHKLDIAAADGLGKGDPKFPKLFYDFIRQNVAAVKCEKDFLEGFLPHFEALIGFGSMHFERERR